MRKTLVFESVLGNMYMWGTDEHGYVLYLQKPKDRVIHVSAEMRKSAHTYLASTPMYRLERTYKVLESLEAIGIYGQFKIIPHAADGSFTLEYKRYVPEDVRKAYAQRMQAQRAHAGASQCVALAAAR